MKSRELRIGNYVNAGNKVIVVESINDVGINLTSCGGYYIGDSCMEYEAYLEKGFAYESDAKIITPIPLTEDLLVKCGFGSKYKSCNTDWNIGSFTINQKSNEDDDGNTIPQEQVFYFDYTYEIKYLHQLQNLCYCLTGTELEVKL